MSKINNKKKAYRFMNELNEDDNILSVTLSGSYSENFDEKKAGDIDIIIICKKFDKFFYKKCIKKIRVIKKKYFSKKKNLIINSTFGPIKFYKKNSIVFHLMIYDLKSHINHTINSPFTCYDWERSKIFVGKSLKELCPVYKIQLRDFYEGRRSINNYLNDICNNRITYSEYKFKKNKAILVKKFFKINKLNKRDFVYHTIKFLLINFIKYKKNKNTIISNKEINLQFNRIVDDKKFFLKFKKLRLLKINKSTNQINDINNLVIKFITKFNKYIDHENKTNRIFFSRHKKTLFNNKIFLGQKINPTINDKKIKNEFKSIVFEKCFSSPLKRCIETAKLITDKNKITSNNYLKEINYGNAEGLSYRLLKKKYPIIIKKWNEGKDPKFPNGESTSDVCIRLNKFIKKELNLNKIRNTQNLLVITHNVFLRCLVGKLFNINLNEWYKININYFDLIETKLIGNVLLPNIQRKKFLSLFKNFI